MTERAQTVLVTGANRGLGLETCRQLAARGFQVLLTSRSESGREAAAALGAEFHPLDVGDAGSVAELMRWLVGRRVDVLVNNAGVSLDGFDADVARRTLAVNLTGALRVTDALLGCIPDGGSIVMVSSGMGELSCMGPALRRELSDPELDRARVLALMESFVEAVERGVHAEAGWPSSAYRVSKAAINALTRVLARELAGRAIRVNAVCPGWVRTDMGGRWADRDVREGAASIVWAAALEGGPTGGFFRDGEAIAW